MITPEHKEIIKRIAGIERKKYSTSDLVHIVHTSFPEYRHICAVELEQEITTILYSN